MSFFPIELNSAKDNEAIKIQSGRSGNWYSIDADAKIAKVWIIGPIYNLNDYSGVIALMYALTQEYTLHIYIHSPGGAIATTAYIISAMASCKATVVTHNIGIAASCGSLILCCGSLISIAPYAITMFHASGYFSGGTSHRIRSEVDHLIAYVDGLLSMMKDRGCLTDDECHAISNNGTEFYIPSSKMIERLQENNILYSGGK
jgi:ATP-dependent protease ClpP protease subunit